MQNPDSTLFEPYKGLRPYEAQDSELFFGRDAERDILIDKILSNKLTLLFAATGVGKSSLLHAAVLPKLKESEGLDVVYYRNWSVASPMESVKKKTLEVLHGAGKIETGYAPDDTLTLQGFFQACSVFASQPLVLMLDQFEEFFYYQRLQKGFQDFITQLSQAFNNRQVPVAFVISMREDFALELNAFKEHLSTTLFQNFFRLEKLTREKALKAIEEPVKKMGCEYEPELRDSLLQDLAEREKQSRFGSSSVPVDDSQLYVEPPYLQIVCTQLWDMEKRNPDKKLHAKIYQQKGGASGFVDTYFGGVMKEFSTEEKRIASRSFDFLITPYGTKMAYPVKELSPRTRTNRDELEKVLNKLQNKRVLRGQKREDDTWYELYHDIFSKIIHQWNESYKTRERNRKGMIYTAIGISIVIMLYAMYDFITNYTDNYLKLSSKAGISDTIEVWHGRPGSPDWFHIRGYEAETACERKAVEPDKQFEEKPIPDYDDLNKELAGFLPVTDRISAYWQDGQLESFRRLAAKSITAHDMTRTADVIQRLASSRSRDSMAIFQPFLGPGTDPAIRETIAAALVSTASFLAVNPLTELLSDPYASVRRAAVYTLANLGSTESAKNILPLLKDPDASVRSAAVDALRLLNSAESVEAILPLLKEEDPNVKWATFVALGKLGATVSPEDMVPLFKEGYDWRIFLDKQAVESILLLLKDQDANARTIAVGALGELGAAEFVNDIVPLLKDQDAVVRQVAAEALGKLGAAESAKDILPLMKDQDVGVRQAAVGALAKLGASESVKDILPLLKDQDAGLRQVAVGALAKLGATLPVEDILPLLKDGLAGWEALDTLAKPGETESLQKNLALLKDPNANIRKWAVFRLERQGGPEFLKDILPLLKDQDANVRIQAVMALARLGGAESAKDILPLLKDQDAFVRSYAVEALGTFGTAESVNDLVPLLKDQNKGVRETAYRSLVFGLGSKISVKDILPLLNDRDAFVRATAVDVLGELGSTESLEKIVSLLKDPDADARRAALVTSTRLSDRVSVNDILLLLKDKDVRRMALDSLVVLGSTGSVKDIVPLLKDLDADVRIAAIGALGSLGSTGSVKQVLPLLIDRNESVRVKAVEALGKLDSTESLKDISSLLHDKNTGIVVFQSESLRCAAVEALGRLGGKESVKEILPLLKDQNESVRIKAVEALGKLGSTESIEDILPLLNDKNTQRMAYDESGSLRVAVVKVLGRLGGKKFLEHLLPLLKDKDASVREAATIVIGNMLSPEEIDVTKEMCDSLNCDKPDFATATVLLKHNDKRGIEFINQQARSKEYGTRRRTAEILGAVPSKQGTALLLEMLKDERAEVRKAVVVALVDIGSVELFNTFKNIATDEKERVQIRFSAIEGIERARSDEAENILVGLLQSEEPYQFRAIKALGNIGSPRALPELKKLLTQLEDRKAQWRLIRDNEPETEAERDNWRNQLESVKPKTYLECELAYTIARIDPEGEGIRLLSHDLAAVREGTWMGIGKTRRTDLLEKLYEIRKTTHSPFERHAAYRAIDHLLVEIEEYGGKADLDRLGAFLPTITSDPLSEGVKTRVEWTKQRLEQRNSR